MRGTLSWNCAPSHYTCRDAHARSKHQDLQQIRRAGPAPDPRIKGENKAILLAPFVASLSIARHKDIKRRGDILFDESAPQRQSDKMTAIQA